MKLDDLKQGDVIVADDGFTCMPANRFCLVIEGRNGKYVLCEQGDHYLDGQDDGEGNLVGFRWPLGKAR